MPVPASPVLGRLHGVLRSVEERQEAGPPVRVGPDVLDRTAHGREELPGAELDGLLPWEQRLVEGTLEDEHLLRGDRLFPTELVVRAAFGDFHEQELVHDRPRFGRASQVPDPRPLVGLGIWQVQVLTPGVVVPQELEEVERVLRTDVQLVHLEDLAGPHHLDGGTDGQVDLQAIEVGTAAGEEVLRRGDEQVIATLPEDVATGDTDEPGEDDVSGPGVGEVVVLVDLLGLHATVVVAENQSRQSHESHPSSKAGVSFSLSAEQAGLAILWAAPYHIFAKSQ